MKVLNILMSNAKGESRTYIHKHAATRQDKSAEAASKAPLSTVTENDRARSQKDQILTLLEAYDGRMWQQDVLVETGYSAGKVSRLLSEMEEDGQITRYWKNGAKVVADPELLPAALIE